MLENQPQTPEVRCPTFRRSLPIADDSSFRADVVIFPLRGGLVRSITLPYALEKEEDIADETMEPSSSDSIDLSVLLDLKLGTQTSSPVPGHPARKIIDRQADQRTHRDRFDPHGQAPRPR